MLGTLSTREIDNLLCRQVIGRIGCHANGLTYVVPTSYVYENDSIYCHSEEGLKVTLMRYNPDVCFEVDDLTNVANWKSVVCWGVFEEITEQEQRRSALQKLLKRNLPLSCSKNKELVSSWPFHTDEMETVSGVVYAIRINKKTGRFENSLFAPGFGER